ncbi:hypothetical protein ACFR9U_20275 [Halorientalis brevis]|uniref:RING-type E3 ubiquitin transferase n=1 Tax=Halorientalis brevis TaxID=1126241 RepID=A0ABD6CID7_9EURY|nr:hypothetical protein [Halorientalis brevis]
MASAFVVVLSSVLGVVALASGYRTLTAIQVFRLLSSIDAERPPQGVDGDPIAIEGDLVVDEPIELGDPPVDTIDSPVGAYVWRARFPDNTNQGLTAEDGGWQTQHYHTFASGIEWGQLGVETGDRTIAINPEHLRSASESEPLAALTVGGITKRSQLSVDLWDSWSLFLRKHTVHLPLSRFEGTVERHNDGVALDRYLLEAKPLVHGETISVYGEGHVDEGEYTVRGSEDVPLLLSDQGFDGHRSWLGKQVATKGTIAASVLLAAVGVWFQVYLPLLAVVAATVVYILWHFVGDMKLFLRN